MAATSDSSESECDLEYCVVEKVFYYSYMEIHFFFQCDVSEDLYIQLRKSPDDNPPRRLAPHNYFTKVTKDHHVYYGLDPTVLRKIPNELSHSSPYFKVIDMTLSQITMVYLEFDEQNNRLKIVKDEDFCVVGDSHKLSFIVNKIPQCYRSNTRS